MRRRTRSWRRTASRATRPDTGTSAARATRASRDSPPTSASTAGETVDFKIDTDADRLPPRHLPPRLLRRARRAPGRDGPAVGRAAAEPAGLPRRIRRPASSTAATGRSRRRGPCRPTPSRASTSRKLVREDGTAGASHIVFVVRDDDGRLGPALPDVGHDLAGLQPVRRQQPLRRLARPAAPTR